jgi:hypothetical protein
MASYENQGRAAIVNDIPRMGILPMAQASATKTLVPMIVAMGYAEENITITFRKEFTLRDLPELFDSKTFAR